METLTHEEQYKKDKKQFLGGMAIVGADIFPFWEAWHNHPEGFVGNMSRLATLGLLTYGGVKAHIGGWNSLVERSKLEKSSATSSTEVETKPTDG